MNLKRKGEKVDWTVKAAMQARPCPACRCWTQPARIIAGQGFVRAELVCWGCRTQYHEDYPREYWDDPKNRALVPGCGAKRT